MISKMTRPKSITLFFLATIFSLIAGCAYYSVKGSLPPYLDTVAVPLFENRTSEFNVAEHLTDTLIDEFTRDGSLGIDDEATADVLIEGVITSINERAGAFDAQETVEDIKIYFSVQVTCTDQVKHQEMWQGRITQWGSYDPAMGPQGRTDAYEEAYSKISQEIINKTVSNW